MSKAEIHFVANDAGHWTSFQDTSMSRLYMPEEYPPELLQNDTKHACLLTD